MATLYRKHRPQTFAEVVNQNHIKMTLEQEIASGNMAQAYLFCGPRGIGKTTLARVFAKAVNCERRKDGEFEPCNGCPACDEIRDGRSFDMMEIDAASHTGVDNVRENIIASSRVSPARLKKKVFIIDEVHMLSVSAFNALLKTLEEPPAYIIFILCTTEIHKVPATIISRCQRFDFKKIGVADITKKLALIAEKEDFEIPKSVLEEIARRSEGHLRDAESLLGQLAAIAEPEKGKGGKKIITEEVADLVIPRGDIGGIISLIGFLAKKDTGGAIRLVNNLASEGVELKNFTGNAIEFFRKLLLAKINPALISGLTAELGEQAEIELSDAGRDLTPDRIVAIIEELIAARNEIRNSFITQLPLELAIVKICFSPVNIPSGAAARDYSGAKTPGPAAFNKAEKIANQSAVPAGNSESGKFNRERTDPVKNVSAGKIESGPVAAEDSPASGNGERISISMDQVMEKWNEVLAKVKKYNHSLSFILRVCKPRTVSGSAVCLAFKYKFHKTRIDTPAVKAIVEKTLKEVYNIPLRVEAVVDEGMEVSMEAGEKPAETGMNEPGEEPSAPAAKSEEAGGGDIMANLLKTFGGRIVG